ncbi:MAG: hypothetical protein ACREFE_14615, partial [Limisphaerales bacterium]
VNAGGVSSVSAAPPPIIGTAAVIGNNLNIVGSGGIANWTYYVLATTNLTAAQWTPIVTNQFDGSGNFTSTLTNAIRSGWPQTFFRLQLQE